MRSTWWALLGAGAALSWFGCGSAELRYRERWITDDYRLVERIYWAELEPGRYRIVRRQLVRNNEQGDPIEEVDLGYAQPLGAGYDLKWTRYRYEYGPEGRPIRRRSETWYRALPPQVHDSLRARLPDSALTALFEDVLASLRRGPQDPPQVRYSAFAYDRFGNLVQRRDGPSDSLGPVPVELDSLGRWVRTWTVEEGIGRVVRERLYEAKGGYLERIRLEGEAEPFFEAAYDNRGLRLWERQYSRPSRTGVGFVQVYRPAEAAVEVRIQAVYDRHGNLIRQRQQSRILRPQLVPVGELPLMEERHAYAREDSFRVRHYIYFFDNQAMLSNPGRRELVRRPFYIEEVYQRYR
ncbi:MAG: hypothetical protein N2561_01260 [Bacteroidetes bacterium]|nr:hypothetical protein [Rhodothermia bacterium]MCS7155746.1 hypothetical protein [Bacteroidota bacterium]MCX7906153.1 hypothetical protein [Bacteroidota bacterium]MDW8138281.1 hypothetical protein [Bacteroidota bacterium]MDW8285965.1 hypothetical protein [Bacteroidota bacterium]